VLPQDFYLQLRDNTDGGSRTWSLQDCKEQWVEEFAAFRATVSALAFGVVEKEHDGRCLTSRSPATELQKCGSCLDALKEFLGEHSIRAAVAYFESGASCKPHRKNGKHAWIPLSHGDQLNLSKAVCGNDSSKY
jgi:hypothetical protein